MDKRKIGFYNELVDSVLSLDECDMIFNNWEQLKQYVKPNDTIVFASTFSCFGYDTLEILETINSVGCNIKMVGVNSNLQSVNKFALTTGLANNEYIRDNKYQVLRLLNQ